MTHILSIAIVVLIFLFYLSTQTLIFPLSLGYLFFMYSLKELPKSKLKQTIWILSIIGLISNLISPNLYFIQEIIVLSLIGIFSYMMDKKSYHGVVSGIVIVLLLVISQIIAYEKNDYFGVTLGLVVLSLGLYYFYHIFNNYLSDLVSPKTINKPKKYNKFLISTCTILLVSTTLYCFQELAMELAIDSSEYKYYFPTSENEAVHLNSPLRAGSYSGLYYDDPESIAKTLVLDAKLYQYEDIDVNIGYNPITTWLFNPGDQPTQIEHRILNYSYCKKEDAPKTIEGEHFILDDYYRVTNISHEIQKSEKEMTYFFEDASIGIQLYCWSMPNRDENKIITIECPAKNSILKGKTFGMSVEMFFQHTSSDYLGLDPQVYFSPYLAPFISKMDSIKYTLLSKDKHTGTTEVVASHQSSFDEMFYRYELNSTNLRLELKEHLDPEKYEYTFEIQLFREGQKQLTLKAVMEP